MQRFLNLCISNRRQGVITTCGYLKKTMNGLHDGERYPKQRNGFPIPLSIALRLPGCCNQLRVGNINLPPHARSLERKALRMQVGRRQSHRELCAAGATKLHHKPTRSLVGGRPCNVPVAESTRTNTLQSLYLGKHEEEAREEMSPELYPTCAYS